MKKLLIILLLFIIVITSSACNMKTVAQYSYDKIHIGYKCYKIKNWTVFEEQIQVTLEDNTTLLLSPINCTLIKGTCPFCGE